MQTALVRQFTTTANAAFDTGFLDVSDFDALLVQIDVLPSQSNGAFNWSASGKDPGGTSRLLGQSTIPATQWHAAAGIGPGCGYTYNGMSGIAAPLPGLVNIHFDNPGATTNLVVTIWGTRIGR